MSRRNEIDVVFVAGPPGAGKTTVTEGYQRDHPNADQFGTGELIWGIRAGHIDSQYSETLRAAVENGILLTDNDYSRVVHERIARMSDDTDTVLVTGFPHDYGDWRRFDESRVGRRINLLGSIELDINMDTSIARMQSRDISRGADVEVVTSKEAYVAYEMRYHELMGRHAIRLDCYRQSGLSILPISAQKSPDEVLGSFSQMMNVLKEGVK